MGYREFEFDLPSALLKSLLHVLEGMTPSSLVAEELLEIPDSQGVYQLFLDSKLVYVGKTDAEAGLFRRLSRHARKIMHRKNLDPRRIFFKAVRIFVFTAMDLETELIRHYGGVKCLAWNGSGFGSNDPGRRRDTTRVDDANFDGQFPIDIDRMITFSVDSGQSAAEALSTLKQTLPYTFRYQGEVGNARQPHSDFTRTHLETLSGPVTVRTAVRHIVKDLPIGWQATALPGYIILYKEKQDYPRAEIVAAS